MPVGVYKRSPEHIEKMRQRMIGNPGYWLGKKRDKKTNSKISKTLTGRKLAPETIIKLKGKIDDKNPFWKGYKIGVIGIHQWLRRKFIKKMICEHCGKKGTNPLSIHWAKLPNKYYERKRENFIELCCKCHVRMDLKEHLDSGRYK